MVKLNVMKSISSPFTLALSSKGDLPTSFVKIINLFFTGILKRSFVKSKENKLKLAL
jgi:hypothetical protein